MSFQEESGHSSGAPERFQRVSGVFHNVNEYRTISENFRKFQRRFRELLVGFKEFSGSFLGLSEAIQEFSRLFTENLENFRGVLWVFDVVFRERASTKLPCN